VDVVAAQYQRHGETGATVRRVGPPDEAKQRKRPAQEHRDDGSLRVIFRSHGENSTFNRPTRTIFAVTLATVIRVSHT